MKKNIKKEIKKRKEKEQAPFQSLLFFENKINLTF